MSISSTTATATTPRQPRALARRAKAAAGKDRRLKLACTRYARADLRCAEAYGFLSDGVLLPEYEVAVRLRTPHQIRFRTAYRRAYR